MIGPSPNEETVAAYEDIALDYAETTRGTPSGLLADALARLVALVPAGGTVLELGSGPGWDADFMEEQGLRVRRTDAARSFCDFQVSRGRRAELLDATRDPLTGDDWPGYDAVVALFVLQHLGRDDVPALLARAAAALGDGGVVLVSVRDGDGDRWEQRAAHRYHVTHWTQDGFDALLRAAGLEPDWHGRLADDDGDWLLVLARVPTPA